MKKISRRSFLQGVGITAVAAAAAACSNESTSTSTATTDTQVEAQADNSQLVFVNYRDIRDLNPHLYAGEMYAQNILYDGLIDMVEDGFEGALAERWEISEDGLTYTFFIREGVTFSDGHICDAYAIQANFDAILANRERHVWLTMMSVLESTEAVDESTFVMHLSAPYYPMLTELSMVRPFAMVSPNAMIDGTTADGVAEYIGTGPYVLTDFVTDEYAVFTRNESYWGELPAIEEILVKVIADNQTRIMALEKGEIDLIFGKNMIDADAILAHDGVEGYTTSLSEPTSTRQIIMNSTDDILSDVNVRYALSYATNKAAIAEGIFYGIEEVAETLYATTVPYCDVALEPFTYDFDKAAALLAEAGWVASSDGVLAKDGTKLEIEMLYNADSVTEKTISEYLQSEYLKLGVKLNIHGEEEQSYRDSMKAGTFEMCFNIAWGTPYDPQSSLSAMTGPVYGDYAAQLGLANKAEIDDAIDAIMVSVDETERQSLFDYVLTSLHEGAIYIPITYECNKAIYTSSLAGVGFTMSQYEIPFKDMYFQ